MYTWHCTPPSLCIYTYYTKMNELEKAQKKYNNDYKIRNKFHPPVEVFQHGPNGSSIVSGLIIFLYYFLYYLILLGYYCIVES